ncbi:hypothetical protein HMPREF9521_00347 [Enterococcus faecalis TX2134]|nr:hypothetical protein HMPREF9521_00347 [Enterococcus faecalis TX2134]
MSRTIKTNREETDVMGLLQDRFVFDGEVLAELCKDVDGEYFVRYFNNSNLYLGAVKLLAQWESEMYEKYKEM